MKENPEIIDTYFVEALSNFEGSASQQFKTKLHLMLLYLRIRNLMIWFVILAGIGLLLFFGASSVSDQRVDNQTIRLETSIMVSGEEKDNQEKELFVIAQEKPGIEISDSNSKTESESREQLKSEIPLIKTPEKAVKLIAKTKIEANHLSLTFLYPNFTEVLIYERPTDETAERKTGPGLEDSFPEQDEERLPLATIPTDSVHKTHWLSLSVFASPVFTQTRLSGNTGSEDYLQLRRNSESDTWTWSAGADIRVHWKNWFVQSGINYSRYKNNKNYDYSYSVYDSVNSHFEYDTTWVWIYNPPNLGYPLMTGIDTIWVPVYQDIHVEDRGNNEWSYLEIPILIGHQFDFGKFGLEIASGVSMGFLMKSKGSLPRFPDAHGMENLENISVEINKTMLNWLLQVGVSYQINDRWSVIAQPYYKQNLQSVFDKNYPIDQRFKAFGLKCGLRVRF
ncbi:MAG: outer membrane beta-barrel protein [Bacteroidales bacterium]|nr:outer membrane beta-barrel protein [Bacteroidales bacterium]